MIDGAVIGAARSQLAGRRLLEITGPLGLGVRSVEQGERAVAGEAAFGSGKAVLSAPNTQAIPMIHSDFTIPIRDIAAAEERGVQLELREAVEAAVATAHLEDSLIFEGHKELGIPGLLNAPGAATAKVGDWGNVGQAAEDLIAAVNKLDANGFPGPYAAALAPALYNALFLLYPQGNLTQLDHVRQLITAGLVKAPALKSGGVVLAAGRAFATIVLGQDLTPAYVGPAGDHYEFVILESLAPRIVVPQAVCALQAGKG
jgi:uncharacterized linocin/CFP29 family protein